MHSRMSIERARPCESLPPAKACEGGGGLAVTQHCGIAVIYDGIIVGEYAVDRLVEEER